MAELLADGKIVGIILTWVFSYIATENYRNFKGSSGSVYLSLGVAALIGTVSFYALLVWLFVISHWYVILGVYIVSLVLGAILSVLLGNKYLTIILCPYLTLACAGFAWFRFIFY